ncbi:MAG: FecCD family ABC transporter permease [Candidatus Korobacteraceae bacterium]
MSASSATELQVSARYEVRKVRVRIGLFYTVLLPALAVSTIAGIAVGSTPLAWETILQVLGLKILPTGWLDASSISQADHAIVWLIRVPRVLIAATVGASLACAGVVMQGLFRNALAEPVLVGVTPGAVLGAVVIFVSGLAGQSVVALPLAAMVSALASLALVYGIATRGGVTPITTLLLAGIATGSLLSAISGLLISLNIVNWQVAQEILFWMMGGLDSRTWAHVWLSVPFVGIGLAAALFQARDLDLLLQGEETAASLGLNVEASKRMLILTSAVLTGASVGVAGTIGFVGLIVPHAVRLLIGPSHRGLIPASAITGAVFLILCDLAARTIHPPTEVRLGIITALCGAPFFLFLLLRRFRETAA